jgi:hypothetical protein
MNARAKVSLDPEPMNVPSPSTVTPLSSPILTNDRGERVRRPRDNVYVNGAADVARSCEVALDDRPRRLRRWAPCGRSTGTPALDSLATGFSASPAGLLSPALTWPTHSTFSGSPSIRHSASPPAGSCRTRLRHLDRRSGTASRRAVSTSYSPAWLPSSRPHRSSWLNTGSDRRRRPPGSVPA